MNRAIGALALFSVLMAGCVDMTSVGTFAKESSAIASNKAALDASESQRAVRDLAAEAGVASDRIEDPESDSFKAQQKVTAAALEALSQYMRVLASLSSKNATKIGSDISSISTSLAGLKVEDAHVKSGLAATQALANLLVGGAVKYTTRRLIVAAHDPVERITVYLALQAEVVASEYDNAAILTQSAWGRLMVPTARDAEQCRDMHICRLTYRLARRESDIAVTALQAKAASARLAQIAFLKIGKGNRALFINVNHLTAGAIVRELRSDEPDLQNAIMAMKG